jgi:NO-binding membrane sensor protein with MHYT domain/nitrogen-specific signal transduction histidine kinase
LDLSWFFTVGIDTATAMPSTYRPSLVVLSYLIASFAGFTFLRFAGRLTELPTLRVVWLAAGAVTMGGGIWAMHFIGMLAYRLPTAVSYDPLATAASVVPAILAAGVALHLIAQPAVRPLRLLVGGVLMGAGIGLMHYSGMAGLRLDGEVRYDPVLFATSLVVAVALSIVALKVRFWFAASQGIGGLMREIGAALILGFAVTAMHYTAMASTYCFAGAGGARDSLALDPALFSTVTTLIAALVLLLALAILIFDRRVRQEIALREAAAEQVLSTTRQLAQAQKMEVVGRMATGMAHEVNQPLTVLQFAVEGLANEIEEGFHRSEPEEFAADALSKLTKMEAQIQRASGIIRSLQGFARHSDSKPTTFDVAQTIDSTVDILREQLRVAGIDLEITPPSPVPAVFGSPNGLQQVLINLIINARDAIKDRVPAGATPAQRGRIEIGARHDKASDTVTIEVGDNGPGIPADVLPKLFEPFFTTKPTGKGTGLGLSISLEIVRKMDGTLTAENRQAGGAVFRLGLPPAPVAAQQAATPALARAA